MAGRPHFSPFLHIEIPQLQSFQHLILKWHSGGRGFESPQLHHPSVSLVSISTALHEPKMKCQIEGWCPPKPWPRRASLSFRAELRMAGPAGLCRDAHGFPNYSGPSSIRILSPVRLWTLPCPADTKLTGSDYGARYRVIGDEIGRVTCHSEAPGKASRIIIALASGELQFRLVDPAHLDSQSEVAFLPAMSSD